MNLKQKGFSLLFILLTIFVLGAIISTVVVTHKQRQVSSTHGSNQTFPDHDPASKEKVVQAADGFLESRVGKSNFHKLYKSEPSRTSFASPEDSKYDFIAYHFLPSKLYDTGDDVFMVQVNRNNLQEIYSDFAPDCTKDSSQCAFKITKDEAIQIASRQNVSGDITASIMNTGNGRNPHLVLNIDSCTQKKSVKIDYSTGQVIKIENGCADIEL